MAATFEVLSITRTDINQIKYSDSYSTAVQYLAPTAGTVYLFFTNTQSSTFDPNDQIAVEAKSAYHNENKYCYSGYTISPYYETINDRAAVHTLLNFFKESVAALDHNRMCKNYQNGFSAWLVLLYSDSRSGLAAHCYGTSATQVLGFLRREYGCNYTYKNESYTLASLMQPSAYPSTGSITGPYTDQEGFFLGAGYIEDKESPLIIEGTTCVFNQQYFIIDGTYVGMTDLGDGFCTTSSPCYSRQDVSDYDDIYRLIDGSSYHYIIAGTGSSANKNYGSSITSSYEPLDATSTAASSPQKYISDFSGWNLHFIPCADFDGEVTIKNNVLEISSNAIGGEILYPDITEPKVKLTSYDIDQSELFDLLDDTMSSLSYKLTISNGTTTLSMKQYFNLDVADRKDYQFIYSDPNGISLDIDFETYLDTVKYQLINLGYDLDVDLGLKQNKNPLNLYSFELFEAYTRGHDFIQETYTTVRPEERDPNDDSETSRIMSYDDNYFIYKYSGRNIDIFAGEPKDDTYSLAHPEDNVYYALIHSCDLLQEDDVTLGETYEQQDYFIEAASVSLRDSNDQDTGIQLYKDTFRIIDYLDPDTGIFDPTQYTEEDVTVHTAHIDLTQCEFYRPLEGVYENGWCDCAAKTNGGKATVECAYQKMGYCPYRFQTEKHPRRIRTLQDSQSNRFNLIQELCETFEFYPYFYIEHESNGHCVLDENGEMKKHVFFATEKGSEKYAGFRYEKNLKSMSREVDSSQITTKLYVESNDSDYSSTGMCSIQTATDNIARTSYILDFSYYTKTGALDSEQVQRDLYGIDANDFAFLPRMGEYNKTYDQYSELIITMTGETLVDLSAEIEVGTTGITAALEERQNVAQSMYQYKVASTQIIDGMEITYSYTTSDTYDNYVTKYRQLAVTLWGNVETLFFSGDYFAFPVYDSDTEMYSFPVLNYTDSSGAAITGLSTEDYETYAAKYCKGEFFWRLVLEGFGDDSSYVPPFNSWEDFKEQIVDEKIYEVTGKMGRYKSLYNEVKYWKRERAKVLNKINDLSEQFHRKYEPYIKEGTFSDDNYLDDNEYYWAGVSVLRDSCEPEISYNFEVIDLSPLKVFEDDYEFALGDTTYVEDIDFFGINPHTGFPNREKIIISAISYDLDRPRNNSITAQNYSSQFEDLFEQITASVQSLTFNENMYKRASNFTAQQYVSTDSLQGTLDIGDLTLLDGTITLDEEGLEGADAANPSSRYDIRNDGVYFSTDGGETWDYGVGAEGINMNYATIGQLDSSKVQIVDGDYIYFLWDKDGINAYRNPAKSTDGLVDFARFNRYGLSLIENNNVRLRAGYEFVSSAGNGVYTSEKELSNQNIGFYLYNDNGQAIFKTETQSAHSDDNSDYSARLSLTGEIFVTNQILSGRQDVASTSNYTLSGQYTFLTQYTYDYTYDENDPTFEEMIWDTYNLYGGYYIYTIDSNGNTVPVGTSLALQESGSIYCYDGTFYAIKVETNDSDGNSCILTTYTISYITSTSNSVSAQALLDTSLDSNIQTIEGSLSSVQQQIYVGPDNSKRGARTIRQTYYVLDSYTESNYINTSSYSSTSIDYYDDTGVLHSVTLYTTSQNGTTSYWDKVDAASSDYIKGNSHANNGVGIYINNKKSVHNDDANYEDKTLMYEETSSGDNHREVIMSGAERQFLIASSAESSNNMTYNNVLSVLKNGVLYLGGTIYNADGTAININGLDYMPDEIKINNPRLILGSNGYVYCQWDKFFNLIVNSDGTIEFGDNSLLSILNDIQGEVSNVSNTVNNTGSGSSSITTAGYYFDEDEVDVNI